MKKLNDRVIRFFQQEGCAIVCTLDKEGTINCSVKGIVGLEEERVFLIDLYHGKTFENLRNNSKISLTAIDKHEFPGYNIKGIAKIVEHEKIKDHIIKEWEERVIKKISDRIIKNVKKNTAERHHPEANFPSPKYLIEVDVNEIIDLAPATLKKTETE